MTKNEIYSSYLSLASQLNAKPKALSSFSSKGAIESAIAVFEAEIAAKRPAAKVKATKRPSISARCVELIMAKKTNDEVWATVKVEFGLDDSKKHYPGWNRAMLKRTGRLA